MTQSTDVFRTMSPEESEALFKEMRDELRPVYKQAERVAADTLRVAGQRFSAVKTTSRYRLAGHQMQRTVWTSDRVAVWGVVRQEERIDGKPSSHIEILRWGRRGHSARTKAK